MIYVINIKINQFNIFFRCVGLILLETYSALEDGRLEECLPKFLQLACEVTGDPAYSMYNLSLREEWSSSSKFCHALKGNGIVCSCMSSESKGNESNCGS